MSYLKLAAADLAAESAKYENLKKDDFITYLNSLTTWLLGIVAIIAVASAIYAGYVLITASDDKEKPAKAKKMLFYAVLGVIVVILSKGVISFSASLLLK